MGKDLFWVGASFSRNDKTNTPTVEGNSWLVEKLNTLLNTPYEIVKHEAAVRPTVIDRRPLLGVHPLHSNIFHFKWTRNKRCAYGSTTVQMANEIYR
jgi:glycine/D-amino acid oxidase-like deaminating enzyme